VVDDSRVLNKQCLDGSQQKIYLFSLEEDLRYRNKEKIHNNIINEL